MAFGLPLGVGDIDDLSTSTDFVTPSEVLASMSASIRSATPTTPDPHSEYIRLDGATVRGLLHVDHGVALGVGSHVLRADLLLYKADAWASGSHSITVEPIDAEWDPETVTWDSQPAVRSGIVLPVDGGGAAGDEVVLDISTLIKDAVALQDATGTPWRGVRLSISTSGEKRLYSAYAAPSVRPRIRIETSRPPLPPDNLQPNAGRAVSELKPELIGRFLDPDSDDTLSGVRVRLGTDDTFATSLYDSGMVAHDQAGFDLDDPPTGAPAPSSLTTGVSYFWQMMVRDNHGLWSDWSEVASFQVVAKAALTLTSPAGSSITSPVPTISWTFTGQEQVEIDLEKRVGGVWVDHWLVRRHVSTATSYTVPDAFALQEGVDYRVTVRGWDGASREDMPSDRAFSEDSQEFVLAGVSV